MALFSRTKKNEETKADTQPQAAVAPMNSGVSHVLLRPRITEKATLVGMSSVYVFDVSARANKKEVEAAVRQAYKVNPRMVRIVSVPAKNVRNMRTGKRGVKQGGKKAYVYLKKGETISIA